MKKNILLSVLTLCFLIYAFGQELPNIAVATFDTIGEISVDEANIITELFISELGTNKDFKIVDRANFDKIMTEMKFQSTDWSNQEKTAQLGKALSANYIIRGQIMEMGETFYLSSTILDIQTAQVIFSTREKVQDLGEIYNILFNYCSNLSANIPKPNYFIGEWITGGKETYDGMGKTNQAYLNPFENYMKKISDDSLKKVVFYNDLSCDLFLSDNEPPVKGVYSYDYANEKFIIESESYSCSGKMTLSQNNKTLYIMYAMDSECAWGGGRLYKGFWKILIKKE